MLPSSGTALIQDVHAELKFFSPGALFFFSSKTALGGSPVHPWPVQEGPEGACTSLTFPETLHRHSKTLKSIQGHPTLFSSRRTERAPGWIPGWGTGLGAEGRAGSGLQGWRKGILESKGWVGSQRQQAAKGQMLSYSRFFFIIIKYKIKIVLTSCKIWDHEVKEHILPLPPI